MIVLIGIRVYEVILFYD